MNVILIISCTLCGLYFIMTAVFCYGWLNTKENHSSSSGETSVAVIVAARNEEQYILKCLDALNSQNYRGKKEFIIADDGSGDNTASLIAGFCGMHPGFRLIRASGAGKKAALAEAIKHTSAELIVTTDADCTMGSKWLESIVALYEHSGADMIAGPVAFKEENTFFKKLQSLELMALMGSTAGALYFNKAIMCNGANLAYSRELYNKLNGFEGIDHVMSGDDVLLMYKASQESGVTIKFLMDREAIVSTYAKEDLRSFIEQRKRWASKSFSLMNSEAKVTALIVYLFSFFLLLMWIIAGLGALKPMVGLPFLKICLILSGIKCVIDFLLLFLAACFFKKRPYLYLFLPAQFIYIFYVVVTGFLGNKGKYEWKGRKIN
ncbi:MAG TPA: glycosyltransferase [Bacteroidia bacterium]|jgi:cellulose synthase/poly-beta-1,6-N-acetylglucosamine synthase-like glycosyltransferase